MTSASPTIVRTTHKFGDYLTRPHMAKFELPKKMSRPWIVNNAFEQEKLKDLLSSEKPVETNKVISHIKETKKDKRKNVGANKKYIRNINDIIAHDNKNVNTTQKRGINTKSRTQTSSPVQKVDRVASPSDAMVKQQVETGTLESKCQENDAEMEEKKRELERDIELEQQQMMNRMFNSPSIQQVSSSFIQSHLQSQQQSQQLMPLVVHNHAGGYYIVTLPVPVPVNPLPPPPRPPTNDRFFLPYSTSSKASSTPPPYSDDGYISRSSTASPVSVPSSDDGYMDESTDDISSLSEAFDEHLEISDVECEGDECPIEEDEELNRLVLSIIED
jgi:hypothetical protein